MAVRFRNATPGTILCLAATVLLAIVSFNTPLLKSLYFLSVTVSSGSYEGTMKLGTLGFCVALNGETNCTGPTVGYEFNPNTIFGTSTFNIPETITKYLTYVLILHVVALGFAAFAMIIAIFAHSPTFPLMCLSIWLAGIASTITFIALIFDLATFYIAKSRIDSVSGASAEIGISVWLTLAAWLVLAIGGCFFGIGNCCGSCRDERESGDPRRRYDRDERAEEDYKMRMMAIDNERQRKQAQEQGLPSFQELTPLKDEEEDKYLIEPQRDQQNLARNGSVVQGVGVGYGRRNNRTPVNEYSQQPGAFAWGQPKGYQTLQNIQAPPRAARRLSDATSAGDFVGIGAGGAGVDVPPVPTLTQHQLPQQGYGQGYYGEHQYNEQSGQYGQNYADQNQYGSNQNYNDPYVSQQQQTSYDPYAQTTYNNEPYVSPTRATYSATPTPVVMPAPTRSPPQSVPITQPMQSSNPNPYDYVTAGSSESYDPGPHVNQADPYDAYDDGLGAIGMAATSGMGRHARDYTGQTFASSSTYPPQQQAQSSLGSGGIQEPRPQHLVNQNTSTLLASPISTTSPISNARNEIIGQPMVVPSGSGYGSTNAAAEGYGDDLLDVNGSSNRPPSYSAGDYAVQNPAVPEKSSYR
ncbi:hypothetical protein L804_03291 [Cryptococcus deuterogattii 2001/935-1]|nr:hypothetical protein L804_03291 [Cryptococcus deuterogattii 2001/935-1]